MKKRIMLIDASGLLFRSYYAMMKNPLRSKNGIPTSAIYGFFRMIFSAIQKYPCHSIAAAFDVPRSTLERTKQFSDYKAHRKDVPEDLIMQIPLAREALDLAGIPALTVEGHEADDVLGSLVKKYQDEYEILIFTGDKDLLQLVNDNVQVVLPDKGEERILDRDGVKSHKGVYPEQITDFLAILGDTSDNIPGVKGIGEKGAIALLEEYNDLTTIYQNLDNIKPALSKKLIESKENAFLSLELVNLQKDLDVELPSIQEEVYTASHFATESFVRQLQEWELFSLLKDISISAQNTPKNDEHGLFNINQQQEIEKFHLTSLDAISDSPFIGLHIIDKEYVQFSSNKKSYNLHKDHLAEFKIMIESFFDGQTEDEKPFIVFDQKALIHFFDQENIILPQVDDLKIMNYLLDPARAQYSVENLTLAYLGKNDSTGQSFEKLKNILSQKLQEMEMLSIYNDIEMPLRPILAQLEKKGVKVNGDLLKELSDFYEKKIAEIAQKIYHMAGKEFNILSPKQLGQILFEDLGLKPYRKTKTKSYSTDAETLEALSLIHPLPKEIIEYRSLSKYKSTYTDALMEQKDHNDRVHTNLHQTVTATGRLSSEDPNLQNIPIRMEMGQKIRSAFIPEEGRIFVSADYSQIELRLFSLLSNDDEMKGFFDNGGDIHKRTAAKMFEIPESEVSSEQRRAAKTINYGISYGMSAFRLANELNIDFKEARAFIENYFETFSGVKNFMQETLEFAHHHGYVKTIYGRRRPTPELYHKKIDSVTNLSHASRFAINAVVQGSAADIIKIAMISVQNMLNKEFPNQAEMILQVHDELLFEVDQAIIQQFIDRLQIVMTSAVQLAIPLEIEIGYGSNWNEAH